MHVRIIAFLLFVTFFSYDSFTQISWQEVTTIEDIQNFEPDILTRTFDQINLDYPGLEKVKVAHSNGDLVQAAKLLLAYYRNSSISEKFSREYPTQSNKTVAEADTILSDVFTIQNVKGKVPYLENGHRDWYYKGPNDDREWAWLSNRHSQVYFLLSTYFDTGNPKYLKYIDLFLRDFILASMPYPAVKSSTSVWRGLEVAARAKAWTQLFYRTLDNEYISPATRFFILSSLPDHAHYNRNFHSQNNWLTMEISALATVAAYFPEYKKSEAWLDYTIGTMTESMKEQVYPDGVQTELTSHYHNVALRNFELFQEICEVAGKELPDFFMETLEAMYGYISHAVRPTGYRMLNNDGDKGSDEGIIMDGVKKFNHADWEYIISNGESGTKPSTGPSYFYPWAGHLISRSGFDKNAHWSVFDIGPYGSGHQHNDKLHISITAYGRDLLVDAGRFAYTGAVAERFRPYAKSSAAHNTVLIDGKGQNRGPLLAEKALGNRYFKIADSFDYASGSFNDYLEVTGTAVHTRSLFYVRGSFWVLVDRVETDRPRNLTTLWHWHPDVEIKTEKNVTRTMNEWGNLAVIPVTRQKFDITNVSGREEPMQGWYSPEYNIYGPNMATLYQHTVKESTNQVWVLFPYEMEMPKIKAKILSEDENGVKISLTTGGKTWTVSVPFMNSDTAILQSP